MLRLCRKAQAFGHLTDFDSVLRRLVFCDELLDRLFDVATIHIRQRPIDGIDANGLVSQVNDRFQQRGKIGITHNLGCREP